MSSKPKSDDYPYRHTVRSSSSPKKMLHKSSYTLEKNNSCNSTNHLHPNYQQYSKSVDHNKFSKTIEPHIHHSSNDSSDTRQSNIHHFRQNNYSHNNLTTSNYSTSTASTELKPVQYERISSLDQSHQIMSNNAAGKQIKENQFPTKSLPGRGGYGVDTMVKVNKFEHEKISSVRKRDEYQPDAISDGKFYSKQLNENAENLYGKIQSSRTFSTSTNSGKTPSPICAGNYDRCNANIQLKGGIKRCDNSNSVVMNCVNNNNYDGGNSGGQLHHFHHHNGNNNNISDNFLNDGYGGTNKANLGQSISSAMHGNIRRSSGEKSRNMLRTNRYSNGTHLTAGTHQLAHMINTLSSPESAYSTGYSTDGTSPGRSTSSFSLFSLMCYNSNVMNRLQLVAT